MSRIELFHGTDHIVEVPNYDKGNPKNDYGKGFYCAKVSEMAKEWACKQNKDGFSNRYELDMDGLKILNLTDSSHSVLNWIALLLKNRTLSLDSEIAIDTKNYIIDNFAIDTAEYDIVTGYRADDSYFRYAESFVENGLSLRSLNKALRLGKLGEQTVLVSKRAYDRIKFIDAEPVDKSIYYPKFLSRDTKAIETYKNDIRKSKSYRDDIFVMDILREEIKNDDPRIRQILFE